jgi:hypothetical protein
MRKRVVTDYRNLRDQWIFLDFKEVFTLKADYSPLAADPTNDQR